MARAVRLSVRSEDAPPSRAAKKLWSLRYRERDCLCTYLGGNDPVGNGIRPGIIAKGETKDVE